MSLTTSRVAIRHTARRGNPIGGRTYWIVVASSLGERLARQRGQIHASGPAFAPRSPTLRRVAETKAARNKESPRTTSLACRFGCSLAYFQPSRVQPGHLPGVPFEEIKWRSSGQNAQPPSPLYRLCEPRLHVCLGCHSRSLSKVRDENSCICCRAAQEARRSIERNR